MNVFLGSFLGCLVGAALVAWVIGKGNRLARREGERQVDRLAADRERQYKNTLCAINQTNRLLAALVEQGKVKS